MAIPLQSRSWVLQYIALSLVWGASFAFTVAGLEVLTPLGLTAYRHVVGSLALFAVLWLKGSLNRLKTIPAALLRKMVVVALLLNVIPGYLFAFAQEHVSTVVASIVNSATPIMTIVMVLVVFRTEKVSTNQGLGVALGLLGGVIALGIHESNLGENSAIGVLALVGAVGCYGVAIPYVRNYVSGLESSPTVLATLQVGIASAILSFLFILEVLFSGRAHVGPLSIQNGIPMLILGIGTGIAYIWHFQVIERAGSAVASTITYPTLLVTLLIGTLVLGEPLTITMLVGALLILLGSWVTQQHRDGAKPPRRLA